MHPVFFDRMLAILMSQEDLEKIEQKLVEVLSQEKGYFGQIYTWGQRPTKYEYVGYELSVDFMSILPTLSEEERVCLVKIINYFEIHAAPLQKMLSERKETLQDIYSDWAWSHFMTVVMFGMLEVAVKLSPCAEYDSRGYLRKYVSIRNFLETNLPQTTRDGIVKRYKTETGATLNSFSEVIEHLWDEIRSGFVHEAGIHYKGLEWSTLSGMGSKDDPIKFETDVPMQELLQMTWQAILNSFGYKGLLKLPKYKK
jgi:hypothetical protein